jgi:hypothetical protein
MHTVGLKRDGTVIATGCNTRKQCNVDNWHDIVAISAGKLHTVGLKRDGTVIAVGCDNYGQCDIEDWCDIVAVAAGSGHTAGLKKDGTIITTDDDQDNSMTINKKQQLQEEQKNQDEKMYQQLISEKNIAIDSKNYSLLGALSKEFKNLNGYKDGDLLSEECTNIANTIIEEKYNILLHERNNTFTEREYYKLMVKFSEMCDYKDSKVFAMECDKQYRLLKEQRIREEKQRVFVEQEKRRKQGLCIYCGGKISGVFTKKCKV